MTSFFVAFLLMLSTAASPAPAPATQSHVTIDIKSPQALKAGAQGTLQVMFKPNKGIHINADPAIDIVPEKNSVIASIGAIVPSKDKHGYVDPSKPVRVSAAISPSAPKGAQTVKLKVVYFLCSDAEGWCNRDEQTIDVRVTVK
ncbi:MAG: hypothetical protein ACM3Q4_15980 [Acidobacteriota bacterium]